MIPPSLTAAPEGAGQSEREAAAAGLRPEAAFARALHPTQVEIVRGRLRLEHVLGVLVNSHLTFLSGDECHVSLALAK